MMTVRRLAFLFLALSPVLPAASVEERLDALEARVSEIQLLLAELSQRATTPAPVPPVAARGRSYTIRSGDSYWSIARRHGVSVEALTRANPGMPPKRLQIGKAIIIPGHSSGTTGTTAPAPSRTVGNTHRVRKGDILGRIAQRYDISLKDLMAANPGVDPRRLRIGKILTIPGQAAPLPEPAYESKDGLAAIPEEADPPIPEVVPDPPAPTPDNPYFKALDRSAKEAQSLEGSKSGLEPTIELVTIDEDLRFSEIARQFDTTVERLNELNKRQLSPRQMIKAGSQLYVPVP